jgi:hypothetical protein
VLADMKDNISVGLDKGHAVTKRELAAKPGSRKGVCIAFYFHGFFLTARVALW